MAERMVEYVGWKDSIGEGLYNMGLTDERIIRCRDCCFKRKTWNGKHPAFVDGCFCAYFGGVERTDQTGFCKWGVIRRKEQA